MRPDKTGDILRSGTSDDHRDTSLSRLRHTRGNIFRYEKPRSVITTEFVADADDDNLPRTLKLFSKLVLKEVCLRLLF
jgi:hypothetical protein